MNVKEFFDSDLHMVDTSRFKEGEIRFDTDRGAFILPTLTDAEREAIDDAAGICEEHAEEYDGTDNSPIADMLRKLLERLT